MTGVFMHACVKTAFTAHSTYACSWLNLGNNQLTGTVPAWNIEPRQANMTTVIGLQGNKLQGK